MNANGILSDEMTLEEKLKAIDEAMKLATVAQNIASGRPINSPVDPALLTICDGCE